MNKYYICLWICIFSMIGNLFRSILYLKKNANICISGKAWKTTEEKNINIIFIYEIHYVFCWTPK